MLVNLVYYIPVICPYSIQFYSLSNTVRFSFTIHFTDHLSSTYLCNVLFVSVAKMCCVCDPKKSVRWTY